jgi:hypothetical protein
VGTKKCHSPEYWDRKIQKKLDNIDLKNWVGCVIWWYFQPCLIHENDKEKGLKLNKKWEWFHDKYVDNYDKEHGLDYNILNQGLKSVGIKYQYSFKRREKETPTALNGRGARLKYA